jgi:flagellar biosynthesis GTPase FlhF
VVVTASSRNMVVHSEDFWSSFDTFVSDNVTPAATKNFGAVPGAPGVTSNPTSQDTPDGVGNTRKKQEHALKERAAQRNAAILAQAAEKEGGDGEVTRHPVARIEQGTTKSKRSGEKTPEQERGKSQNEENRTEEKERETKEPERKEPNRKEARTEQDRAETEEARTEQERSETEEAITEREENITAHAVARMAQELQVPVEVLLQHNSATEELYTLRQKQYGETNAKWRRVVLEAQRQNRITPRVLACLDLFDYNHSCLRQLNTQWLKIICSVRDVIELYRIDDASWIDELSTVAPLIATYTQLNARAVSKAAAERLLPTAQQINGKKIHTLSKLRKPGLDLFTNEINNRIQRLVALFPVTGVSSGSYHFCRLATRGAYQRDMYEKSSRDPWVVIGMAIVNGYAIAEPAVTRMMSRIRDQFGITIFKEKTLELAMTPHPSEPQRRRAIVNVNANTGTSWVDSMSGLLIVAAISASMLPRDKSILLSLARVCLTIAARSSAEDSEVLRISQRVLFCITNHCLGFDCDSIIDKLGGDGLSIWPSELKVFVDASPPKEMIASLANLEASGTVLVQDLVTALLPYNQDTALVPYNQDNNQPVSPDDGDDDEDQRDSDDSDDSDDDEDDEDESDSSDDEDESGSSDDEDEGDSDDDKDQRGFR